TLCLLDGVYTSSRSVITPPQNLNGSAQSPITIHAVNDGAVTIDGFYVRSPIFFGANSYWIVEGLNASRADTDHNVVDLDSGSNHIIIGRVVAWDAGDTHAVFNDSGANNLLEDVAGFGRGRKILANSQGSDHSPYRRAWAMWNFSTATNGP